MAKPDVHEIVLAIPPRCCLDFVTMLLMMAAQGSHTVMLSGCDLHRKKLEVYRKK
jgi:hypothetical protein